MKKKIIPLLISCVLMAFSALSQTTDKSSTPKLDAFRKLKQNSRNARVVDTAPSTQAESPSANNAVTTTNPPAPAIEKDSNTIISNNILSATPTASSSAIKTGSTVTSGNPVVSQNQPQRQVQAQPEQKKIYIDTRLGSSTPQYDTYEKNNNGAGSVTTSPK